MAYMNWFNKNKRFFLVDAVFDWATFANVSALESHPVSLKGVSCTRRSIRYTFDMGGRDWTILATKHGCRMV